MFAEVIIGARQEAEELAYVKQSVKEPHHGELRQVLQQLATLRCHARPAETNAVHIGTALSQFADKISSVQVAARFAHRKKDLHYHAPSQVSEVAEYRKSSSFATGQLGSLRRSQEKRTSVSCLTERNKVAAAETHLTRESKGLPMQFEFDGVTGEFSRFVCTAA
jgi:hypothetical protein